jgi:hypothetical protein
MIIPPNQGQPIVDAAGIMSQVFRSWTQGVSRLEILSGSGSPEGVVNAPQKTLYMNTAGTAGSILYIKRDTNVSGDPKQGWILV